MESILYIYYIESYLVTELIRKMYHRMHTYVTHTIVSETLLYGIDILTQ